MVTFSIEREIGKLKTYQTGWSKEINIVIWNDGEPKYDIRDWSPEHDKMSRGITLHKDEAEALYELLRKEFGNDR